MAKRMKIVTVCGCGLGSSLLGKGVIEKIAREFGVQTMVEAADVGTAKGYEADIMVVQDHLVSRIGEIPDTPVIAVKSFMDEEEIRALLGPFFSEFLQKGE